MKKFAFASLAAVMLSTGLVAVGLGAPASADPIVLQPDPCVITLEATYSTSSWGGVDEVIPLSAVACPAPVVMGTTMTTFNVFFASASSTYDVPTLKFDDVQAFDPASNSIITTTQFKLTGGAAGTYTGIAPVSAGIAYVTDSVSDLNYRVVLAKPFTIIDKYPSTPTCTLTVPNLKYTWAQKEDFVLPNSAIQCTGGMVFDPQLYDLTANYAGSNGGYVHAYSSKDETYDSTTQSYSQKWQLKIGFGEAFPSTCGRPGLLSSGSRRCLLRSPSNTNAVNFGSFSEQPEGALINVLSTNGTNTSVPLTLAKPIKLFAATDIVLTPSRIAGTKKISIHIQADRNQSFQSGTKPSYKRQTVIPGRTADQPTLMRGNKVIKTITLTKFGEATVTVKDKKGKQMYTVAMPKTAENFKGTANFTM